MSDDSTKVINFRERKHQKWIEKVKEKKSLEERARELKHSMSRQKEILAFLKKEKENKK